MLIVYKRYAFILLMIEEMLASHVITLTPLHHCTRYVDMAGEVWIKKVLKLGTLIFFVYFNQI